MEFEVINIDYEEYTEVQEIKKEKRIETKKTIDVDLPLAFSSNDESFGCLFNIGNKLFEIEFDYNDHDDCELVITSLKSYKIICDYHIDYAYKYKIDYEIFKEKFSKYLKIFNDNFGD